MEKMSSRTRKGEHCIGCGHRSEAACTIIINNIGWTWKWPQFYCPPNRRWCWNLHLRQFLVWDGTCFRTGCCDRLCANSCGGAWLRNHRRHRWQPHRDNPPGPPSRRIPSLCGPWAGYLARSVWWRVGMPADCSINHGTRALHLRHLPVTRLEELIIAPQVGKVVVSIAKTA